MRFARHAISKINVKTRPLRVLIVDDEEIVADSLARILREKGFSAHAAYNGEDALESAASLMPDVLVSDVIMPGINGVELAVRISKQFPDCRVILFSALAVMRTLLKATVRRIRTSSCCRSHFILMT
jgi:CheY-like chemotaxis protein